MSAVTPEYYAKKEASDVVNVTTVIELDYPNTYTEVNLSEFPDGTQQRSQLITKKLTGAMVDHVRRVYKPSNRDLYLIVLKKAVSHAIETDLRYGN